MRPLRSLCCSLLSTHTPAPDTFVMHHTLGVQRPSLAGREAAIGLGWCGSWPLHQAAPLTRSVTLATVHCPALLTPTLNICWRISPPICSNPPLTLHLACLSFTTFACVNKQLNSFTQSLNLSIHPVRSSIKQSINHPHSRAPSPSTPQYRTVINRWFAKQTSTQHLRYYPYTNK